MIVRRPAAERDIEEHAVYIGQNSPAVAERFLQSVERTLALLEVMPELAGEYPCEHPDLQDEFLARR